MPILRRISFLALLVILATMAGNAQYQISGTVRTLDDQVTGQLLAGVRIEVDSGAYIAMTDTDGTYMISGISAGSHNLKITKPGYKGFFESAVNVSANTILNISLPSLTQVTDMGTDTLRINSILALYLGSAGVSKEPVFWRNIPINIWLRNANSYDSSQANKALGFDDWKRAPAGSVSKHLRRNMYVLADSTNVTDGGGVILTFHGTNNTSNPIENLDDPGYFIYGSSEVAVSNISIIQHEVAGWGLSKSVHELFSSNMNHTGVLVYTLEDVVLTWVAENHKNAKLRGEQDAHLLNMIDYIEPTKPNIPSINATNHLALPQRTTITWTASPGTDYYHFQLATDSTFNALTVNDSVVQRNSKQIDLAIGKTYYARVRAKNTAGTSVWSNIVMLKTAVPETTVTMPLAAGWNMISIPVMAHSMLKDSLLVRSTSPAYTFEDGYFAKDTLQAGVAYWIKYSTADTATVTGSAIDSVSVAVVQGWNMVGSLTTTLISSNIMRTPPELQLSSFFRYSNGYVHADTLLPGVGFWVKTNTVGKLTFVK